MLKLLINSKNSIRFMIRNIYPNIKDKDGLKAFLNVLLTAALIVRVLNARLHVTQNI